MTNKPVIGPRRCYTSANGRMKVMRVKWESGWNYEVHPTIQKAGQKDGVALEVSSDLRDAKEMCERLSTREK